MKFPFLKEATKNLFSKPSTVQFPNKVTDVAAKPGYRGRIAYDPEKCIVCGMCEKVCSPGAITLIREEVPGGEQLTREFDLTSCTFCGTCADFCDEGAIQMTEDYHMVATDAADLIVRGTQFKEASSALLYCGEDCIYCTLCARNCPHDAITVDRAAKTWQVDHSKCVQCGICVGKCPKKTLSFKEPDEIEALLAERASKASAAGTSAASSESNIKKEASTGSASADKTVSAAGTEPSEAKATVTEDTAVAENIKAAENTAVAEDTKATENTAVAEDDTSLVCSDACIFCTLCARNCPVEAITVDREAKTWSVDKDKCIQCGLCVSKCPKSALTLK